MRPEVRVLLRPSKKKFFILAGVAESVDALRSGRSSLMGVGVRLPPPASDLVIDNIYGRIAQLG